MKLTPIKVKGKGQKKPWRPPGLPRATKRRRDADEGDSNWDEPRRTRFKSKRPAAPIEELPTEVLERIIFMSRNLNFLRSSLRIGYRFSSTSFLSELLEAAFAPTWDMWYGHNRHVVSCDHEYLLDPDRIPGDADFQSAALACKWANITLILEAQQKWYRRHGGPGNIAEHLEHPSPPPSFQHSPSEIALGSAADVAARFEKDWEEFKGVCVDLFSTDLPCPSPSYIFDQLHPDESNYLELHPSVTIPQRLLEGPFDWETARTLFWLLRGGAWLSTEHTWLWESTKRGYDHLMALDDKELGLALLLLLGKLSAFKQWPLFLLEQEFDKFGQPVERPKTLAGRQLSWYASLVLEKHRDSKRPEEEEDPR